jgi:hypothetical protein
MEFLVISHDRTDDEALARRMAVRERCRAAARRTERCGNVLSVGATLGEEGHMVGSTAVLSFPGRIAFHKLAGKRFPTTVPGTGSRARSTSSGCRYDGLREQRRRGRWRAPRSDNEGRDVGCR